ncbi:MAG: FAD-dependent monooxygenase [Anaerolineae bacterium]|nr:FAD-dependent monooxygenase [Anaerolineae bacterium]
MATRAIVIGGSMAGLLTARVLAEFFDTVTIIERDTLPDGPEYRHGVPQGRHVHALLAQGQQIMETLFPGLDEDFVEIGAPRLTWGIDTAYMTSGGWLRRFNTGINVNQMSRVALEFLIRRRLQRHHPNVTFVTNSVVDSLVAEGDRVTGVRYTPHEGQATTMEADLVVDASGRNSKAPEWLKTLGYDVPSETVVKSYIGYATRWYEMPDNPPDWRILFIQADTRRQILRGAALFEVEGGRWLATLGGVNKDYPPTDEEGFLAFARTLRTPVFYDAIKDAKPLSPIYGYRIEGNRLRHFEKLARQPERFIAVGDAVCAFNPLYGQGMTVAAIEALLLRSMLAKANPANLDGFARTFHREVARAIRNAWLLATGEDLRYPGTEGAKPGAADRFVQWYTDRVLEVMPYDETITRAFTQVANLAASPTAMLRPSFALRVLRHQLRQQGISAVNSPGEVPPRLS